VDEWLSVRCVPRGRIPGQTKRPVESASLTFAAVVYAAIITILGVVIAGQSWPWLAGYAVFSVGLFVAGLWREGAVKRMAQLALGPLENGASGAS
jgi:hypothetical protein